MKTTKSTSKKSLIAKVWDILVTHPEISQGFLALSGNPMSYLTHNN